jgi:hypothetical protein
LLLTPSQNFLAENFTLPQEEGDDPVSLTKIKVTWYLFLDENKSNLVPFSRDVSFASAFIKCIFVMIATPSIHNSHQNFIIYFTFK